PEWLRGNALNLLFQARQVPDPEIMDVPTVTDLAGTEDQRKDLQFLFPRNAFGRPYATPPGIPATRLKILQDAFAAAADDPELRAEMAKLGIPVTPTTAEALANAINEKYATPADVVERVRKLIATESKRIQA